MATIEDFFKFDIRIGIILQVEDFPEAKKPAYKLQIDFGADIGMKKSSAQITHHYKKDQLAGKKVLAIVNLPPRQIGPFLSEVLTLGVPDAEGHVVLITPDLNQAAIGGKLY